MLAVPSRFQWLYDAAGAADNAPGIAVTPGASDTEGSWTQIATSANIANDAWFIAMYAGYTNATGVDTSCFVDIGVDPAGGTTYTAVASNFICGQAGPITTFSPEFILPLHIPAGSSVAVRAQSVLASPSAARAAMCFFGSPSNPEVVWKGYVCETLGTVTGTTGTAFTPGTAAWGSWVSMGTCANDLRHVQVSASCTNTVIAVQYTSVQVAYGDATNKVTLVDSCLLSFNNSNELRYDPLRTRWFNAYCNVPAGSEFFIRGYCNVTPATGYHALVHGVG